MSSEAKYVEVTPSVEMHRAFQLTVQIPSERTTE